MNYQKNTQFTTGYIQIPSFSKLRLGHVSKASPLTQQPSSRLLTHGRVDLCVGKVSSWIPSTVKGETWTLGHLLNAHCPQWPCSIEVTFQSVTNLCPLDYKPRRDQVSVLHSIHVDFSLKIFLIWSPMELCFKAPMPIWSMAAHYQPLSSHQGLVLPGTWCTEPHPMGPASPHARKEATVKDRERAITTT